MNSVSGYRQSLEGVDRHDHRLVDYLACLRIVITDSQVIALAPKSDEFPLKINDVILGPFNFYPKQNDSIVGGKCHP